MNVFRDLFQKVQNAFSHHADTGAIHGDADAMKALLGALVDRAEKASAAVEAGLSEEVAGVMHALEDKITSLETRLSEALAGLSDLQGAHASTTKTIDALSETVAQVRNGVAEQPGLAGKANPVDPVDPAKLADLTQK